MNGRFRQIRLFYKGAAASEMSVFDAGGSSVENIAGLKEPAGTHIKNRGIYSAVGSGHSSIGKVNKTILQG